jgi:hypothetical protein
MLEPTYFPNLWLKGLNFDPGSISSMSAKLCRAFAPEATDLDCSTAALLSALA